MVLSPSPTDDTERLRLGALLFRLGEGLREVSWEQAERDAARLAGELARRVPELDAAELRAIPRGGLFVLGMLAYLLDLPADRLAPAAGADPGRPLVLVDDCALSGLRVREALAAARGRRVVVAHLYSPAPVRRALAGEPGVVACVAARDLEDRTPEVLPDAEERRAAEGRWRARLGDRPWYGLAQPVAFPWNEPDRPFWNELTGRAEDGWRLVPPHRNLKARGRLGDPAGIAGPSATAPGAAGPRWRLAEGVAWGDFDGVVWLCRTADRRVFSLTGVAADLWRWTASGGGEAAVAARAAAVYAVEEAASRRDLDGLLAELSGEGLMERRAEGAGDDG